MVLLDRLRGTLEVACFSVLSTKLGKSVTISPSLLSTLSFGIFVLVDRLRGALDVAGFSMLSAELGKSVVMSPSLLSTLSFGISGSLAATRGLRNLLWRVVE